MALYLGDKKVAPTNHITKYINSGGAGGASYEGTATVDSNSVAHIDALPFEPRVIVLYKYVTYPAGDFLENYSAYTGNIITCIKTEDGWIGTLVSDASGQICLYGTQADANASTDGEQVTKNSDGSYDILLRRSNYEQGYPSAGDYDITDVTMNVLAYA